MIYEKESVNIGGSRLYADTFEILSLPAFDIAPSLSTGCCGVEGGASGHAKVETRVSVSARSNLDLASKAGAGTFAFTQKTDPSVGDPFFLINQIDSLGIKKLNIKSGEFSVGAGLDLNVGGSAWGHACLTAMCLSASLKLKADTYVSMASVSDSGLKVFGSLVDGGPPYQFSGLGGMASASANLPTFAKTFTDLAPGAAAIMAPKQESVLNVKMDVAGLVAKAAGFPIPLKGDLMGFGYELLSLDAFAGMNLEHAFKFQPQGLKTVYEFSSPVEVFDSAANAWGAPVTKLSMGDGELAQLRSPFATSLGMTRSHELDFDVNYDFNLLLDAGVDLSALELHGFGLSLGPLLNPDPWKVNLGKFDLDAGSAAGKMITKGATSTLSFKPYTLVPGDDGAMVEINLCTLLPDGCSKTGYVKAVERFGDFTQQTTYRVTNFGFGRCGANSLLDCIVDPDFVPVVTQFREHRDGGSAGDDAELLALLEELGFSEWDAFGDPGTLLEYAESFARLDELLGAAPLPEDPAGSRESLIAALQALGVDPLNPFPDRPPLTGAPPLQEGDLTESRSASLELSVPEPPVVFLLALAGAMLGIGRRRPGRGRGDEKALDGPLTPRGARCGRILGVAR